MAKMEKLLRFGQGWDDGRKRRFVGEKREQCHEQSSEKFGSIGNWTVDEKLNSTSQALVRYRLRRAGKR